MNWTEWKSFHPLIQLVVVATIFGIISLSALKLSGCNSVGDSSDDERSIIDTLDSRRITKYIYEGHEYLIMNKGANSQAMTHSGTCPKMHN